MRGRPIAWTLHGPSRSRRWKAPRSPARRRPSRGAVRTKTSVGPARSLGSLPGRAVAPTTAGVLWPPRRGTSSVHATKACTTGAGGTARHVVGDASFTRSRDTVPSSPTRCRRKAPSHARRKASAGASRREAMASRVSKRKLRDGGIASAKTCSAGRTGDGASRNGRAPARRASRTRAPRSTSPRDASEPGRRSRPPSRTRGIESSYGPCPYVVCSCRSRQAASGLE